MLRFILTLCLLVTYPLHVNAAKINAEGAQKLKQILQDNLDYQKTVNESFGSVSVTYEGELVVEQKDGFYKATFPHIKLTTPEHLKGAQNFILDIGVITLNAMPGEKPGIWKTTLAIPPKITMSEGAESEQLDVTFGEQKVIGLLDERLGYFTKINMQLNNITATLDGEDLGVLFGGIQFYQNMEEKEPTKYSGKGHITLSNIDIRPPEEEGKIVLDEFKVNYAMGEAVLPTLKSYQEKLLSHAETFKGLAMMDETGNPSSVDGEALVDMIFDLYDFDMKSFSFGYSLKNLNIDEPNSEPVKIGAASIELGLDGLGSETGAIYIKSSGRDMPVELGDDEIEAMMPSISQIMIRSENIPYNTLATLADTSIRSIVEKPETSQMIGLGLMMRLPGILAQADTKVIVEDSYIGNDMYNVSVNGTILTDLAAMGGFSATSNVLFEGMDALQSALTTHSTSESIFAQSSADAADFLGKLKSIGSKKKSENGKNAYSFDIKTTPEGGVLVNEQDPMAVLFATE
ncbi:MAG: hypothetical protein ACRBDL_02385 [Alphaproteobacteria bacterium]